VQLTSLRIAAGLTQTELAESAGVSRQAVSLLERGKQKPWSGTHKRLLAILEREQKQVS
jgi:transcriptional regulator with XRE-family HTH domain